MEYYFTKATHEEARWIIEKHHYSRSMPANSKHIYAVRKGGGLFGDYGDVVACCLFSGPVNRNWPHDSIELIRLVTDGTLSIPLSKFFGWAIREIKKKSYPFLISLAAITGIK